MKPKTMILMIVAVVCGLGASYMTSRLLAEREEQPPPPPQVVQKETPKVTLLYAKKPIALGQVLRKPQDLFQEKTVTADEAPKDAIRDWKDLEGKTLSRGLRKDDPVYPDDIKDGPVTLKVPEGMRAVGVRVDQETVASGFAALPGSQVDLYWITRGNTTDNTQSIKLLQNVHVLAADMIDTTPDARALVASVVTLALSPLDTQKVTLAKANGTLCFVLRPPGDTKIDKQYRELSLTDLLRGSSKKDLAMQGDGPKELEDPDGKLEEKDVPTAEEWEPIPAPKIRTHKVTYQVGDQFRTEIIEIPDEDADAEDTVAVGGSVWSGSETLAGYHKLTFHLLPGQKAVMDDRDGSHDGTWVQSGNQITLRFYSGSVVYTGTVNGSAMSGTAFNGRTRWNWTVSRQAAR
jgi:pilus assembly protein CpaB